MIECIRRRGQVPACAHVCFLVWLGLLLESGLADLFLAELIEEGATFLEMRND
jgi:hypothetical protein